MIRLTGTGGRSGCSELSMSVSGTRRGSTGSAKNGKGGLMTSPASTEVLRR
jgi:hypothetical protein